MKVVAIVGMNGSGKSRVARLFEREGFRRIRFGDITDKEVAKRCLALTEENERKIREQLRKEYDMDAYAKLNAPLIDEALKTSDVVVDGLYSWSEYKYLKEYYGDDLVMVAVYSSPTTRQSRLPHRQVRPLTPQESSERDYNEIEKLEKGGPIAIADYTLINEGSMQELEAQVQDVLTKLK